MANTYTQVHIHAIFAVRFRNAMIQNEWKNDLYKYITGITQSYSHKLLAINGMSDHVHMFFGMRPTQSLSDLMQDIKGGSSQWINDKKFFKSRFEWQQGFGAFSYSKSQVSTVVNYIHNQEEHHTKHTFQEEYKEFLRIFEVAYEDKYIFKDLE